MTTTTNIFHIIILPILIYICWKAYKGEPTYSSLYLLFVGLATVGLGYHLYRLESNF